MNVDTAHKIPLLDCNLKRSLPKFYRWGGGGVKHTWSFGYLTGQDKDLICVMRDVSKNLPVAEAFLSPVCSTKLLALWAFILKVLIVRIDHNVKDLKKKKY